MIEDVVAFHAEFQSLAFVERHGEIPNHRQGKRIMEGTGCSHRIPRRAAIMANGFGEGAGIKPFADRSMSQPDLLAGLEVRALITVAIILAIRSLSDPKRRAAHRLEDRIKAPLL